ncbi:MAG: hypothetical protein U1F43_04785 [Myxococcota bacterium]
MRSRLSSFASSSLALAVVVASGMALGACGADTSGLATSDTSVTADATVSFDTTTSSDATSTTDASSADTSSPDGSDARVEETVGPLAGLKDDPTYLVPGNIAKKSEVAAFGTSVAWVETPADSGPFFVLWDVASAAAPRTYAVPNLVRPRQLALSHELLVYVDDRYGTPDVFALGLDRGDAFTVVSQPGAQEQPTVAGSRVAWSDCRTCVTGDDGSGWEIWTRAIDVPAPDQSPAEVRLTDDAVPDRRPAFGQHESGRAVLAWVRGRTELRVLDLAPGGETDLTVDVASQLRAADAVGWVAVTPGILAWRTRPLIVNPDSMIVNPDSMYPTDLFATDIAADEVGATVRLTRHGELREGYDGAIRTAGERLAWLESTPAEDHLRIAASAIEADSAQAVAVPGLRAFALGASLAAFIAPRDDNAGLDDLWVLPLPE